jgi:hypothetical protein
MSLQQWVELDTIYKSLATEYISSHRSRYPIRQRTQESVMSGELIKVGQLEIRYLVDGAEKGGLGVFEMTVPAGAIVPPPHSHTEN